MGRGEGPPAPALCLADLHLQVSRGLQVLDALSAYGRAHFRHALRAALASQRLPALGLGASLAPWLVGATQDQLAVFTLVVLGNLPGRHAYGGAAMRRIVAWATRHLDMRALLATMPGVTLTRLRWSARQPAEPERAHCSTSGAYPSPLLLGAGSPAVASGA